jgi:hypothetical protein
MLSENDLLITQLSNNFGRTSQNIGNLSRDIYNTGALIEQSNNALTLNTLNTLNRLNTLDTLERNYNDTQMTQISNNSAVQNAVNALHYNTGLQMEKIHADTNLNTINTANSLNITIGYDRDINIKSVKDLESGTRDQLNYVNQAINNNSQELNQVINTQASETLKHNNEDFNQLNSEIQLLASKKQVHDTLKFVGVINHIEKTTKEDAIGQKDILKQNLNFKFENTKYASEIASEQRLTVLQSTERLAHRLQTSDLEAAKHKEKLSAQILQAEIDLVRSEAVIISAIKKKTCQIKLQIDERARRTQRLVKVNTIERLREDLQNEEIENSEVPDRAPAKTHKCT